MDFWVRWGGGMRICCSSSLRMMRGKLRLYKFGIKMVGLENEIWSIMLHCSAYNSMRLVWYDLGSGL
jgi:hypothetical protein